MQSKGFLAIIGVIIAATLGLIIFANRADSPTANNGDPAAITETDHVRGDTSADAPVTLIEYGDFQCPACGAYDPVMEELFAIYGDQVRFVFRHFPLTQIHPNAMAGHRAAEAAGRQGMFFEMGHLLYQRQAEWVQADNAATIIESYAIQLDLDLDRYRQDVNDSSVLEIINDQSRSGEAFDISATPTFILNGERINSPQSIEEFQQVIDQALAENLTS